MKTISVARSMKSIFHDELKRLDENNNSFEVLDNTIMRLINLRRGDGVYYKLKE